MQFEWDENKNRTNKKKHKIHFETASLVFEDPFLLSFPDKTEGYYEERWRSLGLIQDTVIYIAHTIRIEHDEEIIRIISARAATKGETRRYYFNRKNAKRDCIA